MVSKRSKGLYILKFEVYEGKNKSVLEEFKTMG